MIVVSLTVTTAYQAHGDGAYLPGIGPAPLRFLPIVTSPNLTVLPPLDMGDEEPQPETVETNLSTTNVAATVEAGTAVPDDTNEVSTVTSSEQPGANPDAIGAFIPPSTGYSAVITPQMLTEYFRPMQGATNGVGVSVFVPTEVGFTPPNAQPSSQATYKSE